MQKKRSIRKQGNRPGGFVPFLGLLFLLLLLPLRPCLSESPRSKERNTAPKKSSNQSKTNQSKTNQSKTNQSKTNQAKASKHKGLPERKDGKAKQQAKSTQKTPATPEAQKPKPDVNPAEKPSPLLVRAEEHFFKKRYHIALRLLKRVIEEEPENMRAYLYAADIYLLQQNYGLAEEYFQIARELSPQPYREWFRLGQVRYLRGDAKGALSAFQKSYQLKPTEHKNLFYMGLVYYHLLKNKKKTIEAWREFRKKKPGDPQGPAIDRAIKILSDPNFRFPKAPAMPCFALPNEKESKVPYQPGSNAKEKTDNQGEELIEIDDL